MHTCVHAGLHACTPLLMCKQRSTHKHTLACVRTWRILIIMIDHGKTSGYNRFCSRLYVPACVHTQIHVWMLVCMLVHLCLCVTNHPCMSKCWHACIHEGFWSSWSIMDITVFEYQAVYVPACVYTCMRACMLVCMLVHLCSCVTNHPCMSTCWHACIHEGFWSSWSIVVKQADITALTSERL